MSSSKSKHQKVNRHVKKPHRAHESGPHRPKTTPPKQHKITAEVK